MGGGSMLRGMLAAIESGYIEQEIANSAYAYQMAIEDNDYVVVGVNAYKPTAAQPLEVFEYDFQEEDRQLQRLRKVKETRSNADADRALASVKRSADTGENLFPAVLEAVKARATEGEVMTALRDIYGEYRDPGVL